MADTTRRQVELMLIIYSMHEVAEPTRMRDRVHDLPLEYCSRLAIRQPNESALRRRRLTATDVTCDQ
jgi:hypothetical protein